MVTGAVVGVLAVGLIAAIVAVAVLKKRAQNNADTGKGELPTYLEARSGTDLDDTYGNLSSETAVVDGLSNPGYDDLGAGGFADTSSANDLGSSPTGTDYAMASAFP